MLFKTFTLLALATLTLAAPAPQKAGSSKQAQRVDELRKEGLNCQPGPQGTFVCDDGLGGNCSVNRAGKGTCL
ncbi:hypothetical protein BCR34DRAFT_570595 [Clohesyomyces aquaticus]|uniref:Uncharacterized protein n=1 Tax=Clohesyomyces aquaticus TaxID=1231657 RepID=A0A1Y1ZCK6_9PLEO|nr:hypothetical protein BCR34DRAFT_570595 [Clohesyomyces aquaticus]